MEKQPLVLKFKNKEAEYSFENKINIVQEKEFLNILSRPNYKNQNSSLVIKSMNDLAIADVIQIKVNISSVGSLFTNFNKEDFNEETRNKLLEEIGKLKGDDVSDEAQFNKLKELLALLNNYSPIYASFSNSGDAKIDLEKLGDVELTFPLLVLVKPVVERKVKPEKVRPEKVKPEKENSKPKKEKQNQKPKKEKKQWFANYDAFPLIDLDYLFALIFALLGSFSITASIFEIINKESVATFLIILSIAFIVTLIVSIYTSVYKRGKVRHPLLRYYLGVFIIVGIAIGVISSYFVCKNILKTEIEDFNYRRFILLSILFSVLFLLSSLSSSRLLNLIMEKRKNKKAQ